MRLTLLKLNLCICLAEKRTSSWPSMWRCTVLQMYTQTWTGTVFCAVACMNDGRRVSLLITLAPVTAGTQIRLLKSFPTVKNLSFYIILHNRCYFICKLMILFSDLSLSHTKWKHHFTHTTSDHPHTENTSCLICYTASCEEQFSFFVVHTAYMTKSFTSCNCCGKLNWVLKLKLFWVLRLLFSHRPSYLHLFTVVSRCKVKL